MANKKIEKYYIPEYDTQDNESILDVLIEMQVKINEMIDRMNLDIKQTYYLKNHGK